MSNLSRLQGAHVAIHCRNASEASEFVKAAHRAGFRWEKPNNGSSTTFFGKYPSGICYRISSAGIIMYKSPHYYREHNYQIVPFSQFMAGVPVASPVENYSEPHYTPPRKEGAGGVPIYPTNEESFLRI